LLFFIFSNVRFIGSVIEKKIIPLYDCPLYRKVFMRVDLKSARSKHNCPF